MTSRVVFAALAAACALMTTQPLMAADAPAAAQPQQAAPQAGAMTPDQQYLVDNLKKQGWKATESGLQYHMIKANASGPKPQPGTVVTVHYEGHFIDGKPFDSSYDRHEPATFELDRVIQGWQEGVPMMREGETWEFAIPSDLGYGPRPSGPIPGGSTLIFKVRLLWVDKPAAEAKKPAVEKKSKS